MFRVLFVCEHNSGRSQIAEAYLKKIGSDIFGVESAGLEPGVINPLVVEVMREEGIDISSNKADSVFTFFQEERSYDIVITVCSEKAATLCPLFPGKRLRLNWPFDDPAAVEGNHDQQLEAVRQIRDQIKEKIVFFIEQYKTNGLKIFLQKEG